jgi:hypothetical protein
VTSVGLSIHKNIPRARARPIECSIAVARRPGIQKKNSKKIHKNIRKKINISCLFILLENLDNKNIDITRITTNWHNNTAV